MDQRANRLDDQGNSRLPPDSPNVRSIVVNDRLADSFPILAGESKWLMRLLADDIARIFDEE